MSILILILPCIGILLPLLLWLSILQLLPILSLILIALLLLTRFVVLTLLTLLALVGIARRPILGGSSGSWGRSRGYRSLEGRPLQLSRGRATAGILALVLAAFGPRGKPAPPLPVHIAAGLSCYVRPLRHLPVGVCCAGKGGGRQQSHERCMLVERNLHAKRELKAKAQHTPSSRCCSLASF